MTTKLELRNLVKRFGEGAGAAVNDVSIAVEPGRLVALLGPSGCGKTTTLRMIAGLTVPTEGDICFNGQSVLHQPPEKRNIGMVFQRYVLFPHMTVARNVGFGLFIRGMPKAQIEQKVNQMLEVVQLDTLGQRFPSQLSGGQQQRVAIARTLVTDPQVLLMDEPLSNLDAKLREEMRSFIKALQRRLNITTVFVTHDQVEAMELADEVGVMFQGQLMQFGSPEELFSRPRTPQVADFMGATNLLEGQVAARDATSCTLETALGRLHIAQASAHQEGTKVLATIRPEHIDLLEFNTNQNFTDNLSKGIVQQAVYSGGAVSYQVKVGASLFKVLDRSTRRFAEGQEVNLRLNPASIWVFPEANI